VHHTEAVRLRLHDPDVPSELVLGERARGHASAGNDATAPWPSVTRAIRLAGTPITISGRDPAASVAMGWPGATFSPTFACTSTTAPALVASSVA
jgi:hypothetical protein